MKEILLIDDDISVLEEIADIFRMEGFKVITADDGLNGLQKAKTHKPDIIVSDIMMPNMDGIQLLSELMNDFDLSLIPFIFLTAKSDKSDIRQGMNLGADDYITKPVCPEDLIEAVNNKLKKKIIYEQTLLSYKNQTEKMNQYILELDKKASDHQKSIEKAKKIQDSILQTTKFEKIKNCIDSFVFYKPKDIVSGDFYWCHDKLTELYVALADCTGHGVSAALLTVLGNTFLNQVIIEESVPDPAEALTKLRSKVIQAIHKDSENASGYGMDIALLKLNRIILKLEYVGANIPLWIIRSNTNKANLPDNSRVFEEFGKTLIEVRAQRIPLREYPLKENTYVKIHVDLLPGDVIYMFSDGIVDQFGGGESKKFLSRRLRSLLLEISDLKLDMQKEKIEHCFLNWKGNEEQTDDILILGMKI